MPLSFFKVNSVFNIKRFSKNTAPTFHFFHVFERVDCSLIVLYQPEFSIENFANIILPKTQIVIDLCRRLFAKRRKTTSIKMSAKFSKTS